jgi:hypothetical protein
MSEVPDELRRSFPGSGLLKVSMTRSFAAVASGLSQTVEPGECQTAFHIRGRSVAPSGQEGDRARLLPARKTHTGPLSSEPKRQRSIRHRVANLCTEAHTHRMLLQVRQ